MKNRRVLSEFLALVTTYLIFFALCAFVATVSFLMFFHSIALTEAQIRSAAPWTFINILFITALFLLMDTIRRKISIDRPVRQIKNALRQITGGDFSVRLDTQGSSAQFREIMESINTMTQELSGVETLRTDFVANVSHEMKTPLAVIGNYGTLLQDMTLPEEKRLEYAKAVTESSKRLAELMSNILKLSRLENQQIYPQAGEYDLSEQLCQCLLGFENVWEEKEIALETEIEEDLHITGDAELLAIVWNNLLSNAFKFTGPGGKVKVSLGREENKVVVQVADSGCGMSKEVGRHIFEKFYQGDTSHAAQGNGLGLALVKRIIDITGGTITVSSTAGVGSCFTVILER